MLCTEEVFTLMFHIFSESSCMTFPGEAGLCGRPR
jgi:hypothetical protein